MATINVSFDTVTKACEVTKDGAAVADVSNISMYRKYDWDTGTPSDKYSLQITSGWKNGDEMTSEYHQLMASDNGDLIEAPKEVKTALASNLAALKSIQDSISKAMLKK